MEMSEIWAWSLLAVMECIFHTVSPVFPPTPHRKYHTDVPSSTPLEDFTLYRPTADPPTALEIPTRKVKSQVSNKTFPAGFSPMRRGEDDLCWSAPKIYKPEEQKAMLSQILRKNILMQHLAPDSLGAVVEAMARVEVWPGEVVVREGDQGDGSYIVEVGHLRCTMRSFGHRCDYSPVSSTQGDTFGEVSLMYGNHRAATITAETECVLWKLDRNTFKKIVLNPILPTHTAFREFVKKVEVLGDGLTEEEHDRLVKSSQRLAYSTGTEIVRQDNASMERYMYLVITGEVGFIQNGIEVARTGAHTFFGERCILWEEPARATALALAPTELYRVPESVLRSLPVPLLAALRSRSESLYV